MASFTKDFSAEIFITEESITSPAFKGAKSFKTLDEPSFP